MADGPDVSRPERLIDGVLFFDNLVDVYDNIGMNFVSIHAMLC